jgi:hypothetical protein
VGRLAAPIVATSIRGDRQSALAAASSDALRQASLKTFMESMVAPSNSSCQDSLLRTWAAFHDAWFEGSSSVLPLTVPKVYAVCSMFRAGGYRSIDNYLSRIKDHHIGHGHAWSDQLHRAFRKSRRAVTRGVGPARQSAEFNLVAAHNTLLEHDGSPVCSGGPLGVKSLLVCGCFWMLRELEISCSLVRHITVDFESLTVCWRLPASKTDVMALGTVRSWGCVCTSGKAVPCPVHAVIAQLALLESRFGLARIREGALPLFPSATGGFVEKRHVVSSIEHVAAALLEPLVDERGVRRYGGHSLRVTGARTLAALGVDLVRIQLMARWSSDVVLRYVAEAPLATMTAAYRAGVAAQSLREICAAEVQPQVARVPAVQPARQERPHKALVLNLDSGVVHEPIVWDKEVQPAQWKTTCGWTFGMANTASVSQLPVQSACICSGCFRAEKAAARTRELSSSSSGSSSSSPV